MNEIIQFGLGAKLKSPKDKRTIKYSTLSTSPLLRGGFVYNKGDIGNQKKEGICVGASGQQLKAKIDKKKYSMDFLYLVIKKLIDKNWLEGSCLLSGLKAMNKYGFLEEKLFTDKKGKPYITESDRNLPYDKYIAKLIAIPDDEFYRLLSLCENKIAGYKQVKLTDIQTIAKAIEDSQAGLYCRIEVGKEWFTSKDGKTSWKEKDINPLRPPEEVISGHAIIMSAYDFTTNNFFTLANTWGTDWCRNGCAEINWDKYKVTEAWLITTEPLVTKFTKDLYYGITDDEVIKLQTFLRLKGYYTFGKITNYFGWWTQRAVIAYQKANNITPTKGYWGIKTRTQANLDLGIV